MPRLGLQLLEERSCLRVRLDMELAILRQSVKCPVIVDAVSDSRGWFHLRDLQADE